MYEGACGDWLGGHRMAYGEAGHEFREIMRNRSHKAFWATEGRVEFDFFSASHGRVFSTGDPCLLQKSEAQVTQCKQRSSVFPKEKPVPSPSAADHAFPRHSSVLPGEGGDMGGGSHNCFPQRYI